MSTAGIKIATTITTNSHKTAAQGEENKKNTIKTSIENECSQNVRTEEKNTSFSNLPSVKETQKPSSEPKDKEVPVKNALQKVQHLPENESNISVTSSSSKDLEEYPNDYGLRDFENISASQLSPGLSLLQETAVASSPPPHSYRHSRAYRHFKNPPQPHMCIRTTTENGEELFINVLSWTRIVIPQEPSDPIPLYGGMRVPPGSPRNPPIVFAVMANPEVLKDSGRHSKDPEERRAMVELMCDFVEAMNPGVKLVRNAIILKDRDISGELKDVWNAVQAQRDREREEQMILQRQQHQQHFHTITTTSANSSTITNTLASANNATTVITQQMFSKSSTASSDDAVLMSIDVSTPPRNRKNIHEVQNDSNASNISAEMQKATNSGQMSLPLLAEHLDNKMSIVAGGDESDNCNTKHQNSQNTLKNDALSNGNNCRDSLEMGRSFKTDINNQLNNININSCGDIKKEKLTLSNGSVVNCNDTEMLNAAKTIDTTIIPNAAISNCPARNPPTNVTPIPTAPQAPTKKEKLGGFLPNGCIFPRFSKNNKHKDKDKDKEQKPKEKEKNALLSALKKSKDKKSSTAANSDEKLTSSNSKITADNCNHTNIKQQKNCLQKLECEVQKLDLNNHHLHHHTTHIAEKNINNSAASMSHNRSDTNKSTSSTTSNSDGVGVH